MSYWISAAGVLSLVFVMFHIFGGGSGVHEPLLNSAQSVELKGYVSVIWHGVTASMLLCAALFLIAARNLRLRKALTLVAVVQFAAFAALFIFYGLTRMGSVLVMPQWIGFLLIAGVALVGLYVDQSDGDYE